MSFTKRLTHTGFLWRIASPIWRKAGMAVMLAGLLMVGGTRADNGETAEQDPSAPGLIEAGLKQWETIKTMQATFSRRERLEDKTELGEQETILLRERRSPFSLYMSWLEGPGKNREIAYIEGQNDGKFKVTPGGALGWVVLEMEPNDPRVFEVSRHSVLDAGMGYLLRKINEQFKLGADDIRTKYKGKVVFGGRPCHKFFRYLPQKPKYYCWKAELLIDEELSLPVYIKLFDWNRQPFEEYSYTDLKLNQEFTDDDFNIRAEEKPDDEPE